MTEYYTEEHVWLKVEENVVVLGLTEYGLRGLVEVSNLDFVEEGLKVRPGDVICRFKSPVREIANMMSPLTGKIIEINRRLECFHEIVNMRPEQDGWLVKMQIPTIVPGMLKREVRDLMNKGEYMAFLAKGTTK